jgi:hypothetical protein
MSPDEVEDLLHLMNQPTLEATAQQDDKEE